MAGLETSGDGSADAILSAAHELVPKIRTASDEIEQGRRLPPWLAEAMKEAGIFAMPMPHAWGGPEIDPLTQLRIIETLAEADGSAGWCAMIGCDGGYFTAFLDQGIAREMYPDIRVATGSALTLTGRAVRVQGGGYRVTGRWPFSSGCQHSAWLVGGCIVYEGDKQCVTADGVPESRQCFLRSSECQILDTWHTTGLRGSGSHDFTAADVFVPQERTFSYQTPAVRRSGPLYALPLAILWKFASVPLGIARAAINELVDAAGKRPTRLFTVGGKLAPAKLLRDEYFVQEAVAQAEAIVGSARSYLYDMTGELWAPLVRGDAPLPTQLARWNLAMTNAFAAAVEAVQLIYKARGGSAVYSNGRLDRCLRDVLTINQHVGVSLKQYEIAGRALLGAEPIMGLI